MKKLIYLALAMCSTYMSAQNSITSCSSSFTDMGGEAAPYINSESSDWLICPDDNTKYLSIEFTYVDIETADDAGVNGSGCRDMLYIYDGMDDTAPLIGNFCGQESTDGDTSFVRTNTLEVGMSFTPNNLDGCFYMKFESDGTNTRNGWDAIVECCEPSLPSHMSDGVNCPVAINEGMVFDFELELGCMRQGEISNFTNYTYNEYTPTCMIDAEAMRYKVYYKFEANDNGSFTSINVDPIDDLGEIAFYAIGPLNGSCPVYTGGFVADCNIATDPNSLIFNMSPNSSYMIVVASDVQGVFRLFSDGNTASLPVEMIDYNVTKKGKDVSVEWTTAQEINNQGFELYRSYDNYEFEMIAEIDAKGYYGSTNEYSFTDDDVIDNGNIYYYLRQIDLDGTATDYDVKSVRFEKERSISAYPNPANDRLYIESEDTENVMVTIYSSMGMMVMQRETTLPADVDVSDIPMGVYTMVVESESSVKTIRQVIN